MTAPFLRALVLCVALACGWSGRAQTSPLETRLAAATALAFGRLPLPGESFALTAESPFRAWLEQAQTRLAADPALGRATATRAWEDAFGVTPTAGDLADETGALTYAEHVTRHLATLETHPETYRAVLDRAYRRVVHRPAFGEEITYWREHLGRPLSYILLVGCLDDWARRNQPGLMVTTGTPTVAPQCRALAIVRLSPTLAAEVRAAAVPVCDSPPLASAAGRNLIAPGAARLTTAGGVHFIAVAAGPPPLHP